MIGCHNNGDDHVIRFDIVLMSNDNNNNTN